MPCMNEIESLSKTIKMIIISFYKTKTLLLVSPYYFPVKTAVLLIEATLCIPPKLVINLYHNCGIAI